MSKTKSVEIRCEHCREWFTSPLSFFASKHFDTSKLFLSVAKCPHCRLITGCDKDNFRVRFEDGGFLGVET